MQPFRLLGWWKWMYHLSPFTYIVEGLLGQALGHLPIRCANVELVPITPPSGQTCQQYMGPYIAANGGYITDPNATDTCHFCQYDSTDGFLGNSFNVFYSHHWRDLGIFAAFICFNVSALPGFLDADGGADYARPGRRYLSVHFHLPDTQGRHLPTQEVTI